MLLILSGCQEPPPDPGRNTTARISQLVYPQAQIRIESFADTQLTGDGFDAVVGNVPFSNATLYDQAYNAQKLSMHNHFIVKSLPMTKSAGIIATTAGRETLDTKELTSSYQIAGPNDFCAAASIFALRASAEGET